MKEHDLVKQSIYALHESQSLINSDIYAELLFAWRCWRVSLSSRQKGRIQLDLKNCQNKIKFIKYDEEI